MQADAATWYLTESSLLCLELFETFCPTFSDSQAGIIFNKLRKCFLAILRKIHYPIDFENPNYKEIIFIFLT